MTDQEKDCSLGGTENPDGVYTHDGVFLTGTGQELFGVHKPSKCDREACVIHWPSDHSMREFPTHWREDRGFMERICPHGVGHPDPDDYYADPFHGCDGCCAPVTPENVEAPT